MSEERHSLLRRQLRQRFGDPGAIPNELLPFLDAVDAAYRAFDADRALVERSMDLSSQELLQANAEVRAVFQAFPDLFIWLDPAGTVLNAHAGQSSDLYLAAGDLIGKRVQDFPLAEVSAKFATALAEVQTRPGIVQVEYSLVHAGERAFYEARFLPLVKGQTLVIIRNITARMQAEQALTDEKELLSVTLRAIGDGVITTDTSGRVVLCNEVAEKLTGWSCGEAVGAPAGSVFRVRGEGTGEPLLDSLTAALRDGRRQPARAAVLVARDGSTRTITETVSPVHDGAGRAIGAVIAFRDITEERKLQDATLRASKLESVGTLAGGIAHDFNNLLTGFIGYLSIAQMRLGEEAEVSQWLREAEAAASQARDLTQQLLTFSKGGAPITETASVNELIEQSAVFALRGSNVSYRLDISADLRAVEIDKGQISQVINNLIINADQAMPNGGSLEIVAVNLEVGSELGLPIPLGPYVRISIRDEGEGIPPDHLTKVFDPYFTTKSHGSGLGLATCYSIVQKHGGILTVESTVGDGATFHVYLPTSAAEPAVLAREPSRVAVGAGRGRVLVMDDQPGIRGVAEKMLRLIGYDVAVAADGDAAIALYRERRGSSLAFDLVISDLTVPGGMGGRELLERLRSLDPRVVIIASSGYSNDPVMANHERFGFDGVLVKPYSLQQLDKAVRDAVSRLPVSVG